MFILLEVEEAPVAMRGEGTALAKANARIRALQADNLHLRDEIAESEAALKRLRTAYARLLAVIQGGGGRA